MISILAAAAAVDDERSAESLLAQMPSPEVLEAIARRADEIRFAHPERSIGVARAAVRALRHLPAGARRGSLAAVSWAIYGSTLRNVARLEEAEAALLTAARYLPGFRPLAGWWGKPHPTVPSLRRVGLGPSGLHLAA